MNRRDVSAGDVNARSTISVELTDDRLGDGQLGYVGGQLASHRGTGEHHHACVDRTVEFDRRAPLKQVVDRVGHLSQEKVSALLPGRNWTQTGRRAEPERIDRLRPVGEGTGFGLRKGDKALQAKVVGALDALKKDGTLSALSQKYFKRDIIAK